MAKVKSLDASPDGRPAVRSLDNETLAWELAQLGGLALGVIGSRGGLELSRLRELICEAGTRLVVAQLREVAEG